VRNRRNYFTEIRLFTPPFLRESHIITNQMVIISNPNKLSTTAPARILRVGCGFIEPNNNLQKQKTSKKNTAPARIFRVGCGFIEPNNNLQKQKTSKKTPLLRESFA
jgi:hypothetical protein